ncbi:MAG TPA: thioredoxin domain-containing protein [Gemmatimonadales bacterium]|nr:thioredoxin domain-containing protein [Gemmatimonadales bacterium]
MSSNHLTNSASAYLAAAAHQPVHWYPWGDEAFLEARRRDCPVLLDIGAAWCHWCHVMDRESYESEALAPFLNEHFVCIKVDRDERPDVDARYQRAVQAMSGQGGWPLTALLIPDGQVFFGGTYFPPANMHGRPGFRTVLESVLDAWRTRRDQVHAQAATLTRLVTEHLDESAAGPVSPSRLIESAASMLRLFDPEFGGFGRQPKFPHPAALRFLLARWHETRDSQLRDVVERTLDGMALGGIHDQLGGGFHRYSVDARWIVPHFEKMSYDNSELLRIYTEAYLALGDERYADVARGIVAWVRETLAQEGGGYGASQDADVGLDDDGDFFTWSRGEAEAVLSAAEFEVAAAHWDIGTAGEMHHDPSRNVLFVAESPDSIARRLQMTEAQVRGHIAAARDKLLAARRKRTAPAMDPTRYTAWNAMLASAMLLAGIALDDAAAREHALATLRLMRDEARTPDAVSHSPTQEEGWLEDAVQTADAALTAFEFTGDAAWLTWAEALAERAWREHEDPADGALFDTVANPDATGLLAARGKPAQDAPTPSANGVAGIIACRLHHLTGKATWEERGRRLVEAFGGGLAEASIHGATLLLAADWMLSPVAHMVIVGAEDDGVAAAMEREAWRAWRPRRIVRRLTSADTVAGAPAELSAMLAHSRGGAAGYLCVGTSCRPPARKVDEWRAGLGE